MFFFGQKIDAKRITTAKLITAGGKKVKRKSMMVLNIEGPIDDEVNIYMIDQMGRIDCMGRVMSTRQLPLYQLIT